MKICIAQTASKKGQIQQNIENHLAFVKRAIQFNADLIVFPELSITNYEPDLARALATTIEDPVFNPFQVLSDKNNISIGIGMPIQANDGIHIGMIVFEPNTTRKFYAKQMLHTDELPYFVGGTEQLFLNIKTSKIALGICYETLQRTHFLYAQQAGIDIYIASVAKPQRGIEKAYQHFHQISNEFNIPILMSNCIGDCDNFKSVGQSAIWNKNGELLDQLDPRTQGLLIYNTQTQKAEKEQLQITEAKPEELNEIHQMYRNAKVALEHKGIYQWTDSYPNRQIIEHDIKKGILFVLKNNDIIIGAINISEEQEVEYQTIKWQFDANKVLVIHRLVVEPEQQRKGYARKLMDFAEQFARQESYTSIRLDAYSDNESVIAFYKKRAYYIRGNVYFPNRTHPFHCMEKAITSPSKAALSN